MLEGYSRSPALVRTRRLPLGKLDIAKLLKQRHHRLCENVDRLIKDLTYTEPSLRINLTESVRKTGLPALNASQTILLDTAVLLPVGLNLVEQLVSDDDVPVDFSPL